MYKQSKMIRNLLYFSKFNKKKTIFYHLRVTLVPVHLMMCIPSRTGTYAQDSLAVQEGNIPLTVPTKYAH